MARQIVGLRFHYPPRQTHRADFPQYAFLLFSHQRLCDLSCWKNFRNLVIFVPIPSFPAEAFSQKLFRLPFDVYLPSQVLQFNGLLCHLVLASCFVGRSITAGQLRSTNVTSLRHYFSPIRLPLIFSALPGGFRL